jgi:hypothetical protein
MVFSSTDRPVIAFFNTIQALKNKGTEASLHCLNLSGEKDKHVFTPRKNRQLLGGFYHSKPILFQLGFFIDNVFAGYRVKFFDFQLAGHSTFVFGSGVEVTSTGGRFQFDFIAHGSVSLIYG